MQDKKLSQTTMLLRLLCGGYLVHLGVSLLKEGAGSPLFLGAAVVFILAGAALLVFSLRTLIRDYRSGGGGADNDDAADTTDGA